MDKRLVSSLSSENVKLLGQKYGNRAGPLSTIRRQLPNASYVILVAIQLSYIVPGIHVEFSGNRSRYKVNGLFTTDGVQCMLEGKDYQAVHILFCS